MKLGLQLGYWGAKPPQGVGDLVTAADEAGFDALFRRGLGFRCLHSAGVVGFLNEPAAAGHLGGAAVGTHPDCLCDGRADP